LTHATIDMVDIVHTGKTVTVDSVVYAFPTEGHAQGFLACLKSSGRVDFCYAFWKLSHFPVTSTRRKRGESG
jgi:hypothetical protein